MPRAARIHNLGPNSREDSPRQVIVIDTETTATEYQGDEYHRMHTWCATTVRRTGSHPSRPRQEDADGITAQELAEWIDGQVKSSPPVWCYAHNLSFDLATTRLPVHLTERGWSVTSHNLASDAPWAILRKGSRTLRLVDSGSILPAPLATIAARMGLVKPPLPAAEDPHDLWVARGRADVQITMAALIEVMDWWDKHQLGHWSITGPRTGYNLMRHMCVARPGHDPLTLQTGTGRPFMQHGDGHVVIDPDPDARAFERATLYQGRREAFRVGRLERGMYTELDMRRAHLTVARTHRLPCRRGVGFESLDIDTPYLESDNVSIIAKVRLNTDDPRYPVRTRFGIVHPVGEFETVLAGPEIAEARTRGHLQAIGAGYYYRMSYHMQPWANWAESVLADVDHSHPEAAKIAVKGWSRSVPGTWAARTSQTVMTGVSPVAGWHAEHGTMAGTGAPCTIVHLAGTMQLQVRDVDSDDCFPAVLSFIQAHTRVALNRLIDAIPDYRVVTCSTDSILIDGSGWNPGERAVKSRAQLAGQAAADAAGLLRHLEQAAGEHTLAVKGTGADVRVLSPQHVRMDGKVKYSGISAAAEETERDVFRFHTWPKLGTQMAATDADVYVRQLREVNLAAITVPRWVYGCGCTIAPRMTTGETGNVITAADTDYCTRHPGSQLAERQHPALTRR
jgi:hypothetical protein